MSANIGIPYFPATTNGAVCPACNVVVKHPGQHWIEAKHCEADVTDASSRAAFAVAEREET